MNRLSAIVRWLVMVAALGLCPGLAAQTQSQLRIVKVVPAAANASFPDEDGDFPAYIEIQSLSTVLVSGHYLTDDPKTPNKWQTPAGYSLAPGQTLRVFASGKDRKPQGPGGVLHVNFAYDCSVPFCGLYSAQLVQDHSFTDPVDRCACGGLQLIKPGMIARTLIPESEIGTDWTQVGFADKGWLRGKTGIGFDVGTSVNAEGLVLYHTFNKADLAEGVVQDSSGPYLHKGLIVGAPANIQGQVKEGFEFKGSSASHVRVPNHVELNPGAGSFTVAVWCKPVRAASAATGGQQQSFTETLVSKQGAASNGNQPAPGWSIFRNETGNFVQVVSTVGVKTIGLGSSAANQWQHLVLVINRGQGLVAGFLNGKRMGTAAISSLATELVVSDVDLIEARDFAGNSPLLGSLDEVAIWNRALSDAQVLAVYNLGQQGKPVLDSASVLPGSQIYAGLIGTDVLVPMRGVNSSAYIRVPFNLPVSPALATSLRLRIQYNDGFIAYLNGAEVARRNVPDDAKWNSRSTSDRPDVSGLNGEVIDLTDYLGVLKQGGNVLAFHAMTSQVDAARFLVLPTQLCLEFDRGNTGGECVMRTNGKDFWIAFPENFVQEQDTPLALSICIAGPPKTVGIVELPGIQAPGFPKSYSIPAAGTLRINLPTQAELKGADSLESKAVHVTASADVAVYGTTRMDFTTDSFLALPVKCLSTEYLISAYQNVFDGIPILNGTQFAVVAVANNTEVTITPVSKVGVHGAGVPYTVTLKKGQTYQLRNEAGKPVDMTGTRILSNKPIAVFGSHRCANVQSVSQFFCDVLVEQLLPVNLWGDSHFVAPLATRKGDIVRILSSANDNLITVSTASGNQVFNLDRAKFKDIQLTESARVISRQPVSVMQIANSSDFDQVANSDPFMTLIQPSTSWLSEYRICTPKTVDFESNYLNLVAPNLLELNNITINGVSLAAWLASDIDKGVFVGGFVYARVKLQPDVSYSIRARVPVGLTGYGFSEFDSYGYPGGMEFVDFDPPSTTCPPEMTLHCSTSGANLAAAVSCVAPTPDLISVMEFFDDCTPVQRLKIVQSPPPGTLLPIGKHQVTVSATDSSGNSSQCSVTITVEPPWTEQNFGASVIANPGLNLTVWGPTADPDNDGIPNAIEQSAGSDPKKKNSVLDIVHLTIAEEGGLQFLKVSYKRPVASNGLSMVLEGRSAAVGSVWQSGPDIFQELPDETKLLQDYEIVSFKALETVGKISEQLYFVRLVLEF